MRFAIALASALLLAACSGLPTVDIHTTPVDAPKPKERPVLPNPEPIQTAPFKFKVLTPKTAPEGDYVFYGLTVKDYETLARNMADIVRWIKEAQWRLNYYRGEGGVDGVPSEPAQPHPAEGSTP